MTDQKSSIPSEFERQAKSAGNVDRAAFSLYEASRLDLGDDLPPFWADEAAEMRRDCKYRAMGAYRRGVASCRQIAVLRGAIALAVADGEPWPECNRTVNPSMPDAQRASLCASKRQRYLHLSAVLLADVFGYYETGLDTEEQRQTAIERQRIQREQDRESVAAWRNRMPSTVTQLRKDDSDV